MNSEWRRILERKKNNLTQDEVWASPKVKNQKNISFQQSNTMKTKYVRTKYYVWFRWIVEFSIIIPNPRKLIVYVFLTLCQISMCQGLGSKTHDKNVEIDRKKMNQRMVDWYMRRRPNEIAGMKQKGVRMQGYSRSCKNKNKKQK